MYVAAILLIAANSWATSTMLTPVDTDYDVHDFTLDAQDADHWYSSGLDVVYVNGVRHFIVLWNTNANFPWSPVSTNNSITLSLYDYNGNFVMDIATYTDPSAEAVRSWPQSVKLEPDGSKIWVSYTSSFGPDNNFSDWICTVEWDHTLALYQAGPIAMTPEFEHLGNFEIEWSTDPGDQNQKSFLSGLIPPDEDWDNGIFLYTPGVGVQLVIDIGTPSAGFAFDNKGNLWYGSYSSGPNHIYMWTAEQIDDAVVSETVLYYSDAVIQDIPIPPNLYGTDLERDAAGNIYATVNRYLGPGSHQGYVLRIENNGSPPWPDTATILTELQYEPDFVRSLAFDGLGDLATPGKQEAGNRLYLDMDQRSHGTSTPTIVGICRAGDTDEDGVPDALDNCWQTANADQFDTDAVGYDAVTGWYGPDGYGDVCDSDPDVFNDYDDDGIADLRDWSWDEPDDQTIGFSEFSALINDWLSPPSEPHMDHDADGVVGFFEFQFMLNNWLQPQPLHPTWP